MFDIKIVASTDEQTVVSEFEPSNGGSTAFQSEEELEKAFVKQLTEQSYQYLTFSNEKELIDNLRCKLEKLNDITFSDKEWKQLYEEHISNPNLGIVEKTRMIQQDHVRTIKLDNGNSKNIKLIDKNNIHKNSLQVINQYENDGKRKNIYDVTILVNGLPLVHVELKRRGVSIKEAFNQIERYQRDSFWSNSGLYEFVQIFVISNGTYTKYYSNSTRENHIKQFNKAPSKTSKKTSNSFEFTSYWADINNKVILNLEDFTKTFFSKHTILNILTKYCVFTSEDMLLVMRPYQIAATEKIINKVNIALNYKKMGSIDAGGYIWHTTGSGKTLTSFKTAQLMVNNPSIDKVLFVVDRKDLDYQTMKEYDRFEKGCANGNRSTKILQKQLEDDNCRIIVTTIQKLGVFIGSNKGHDVYKKNVVLIFDECHRSQFGEYHDKIIKSFKKYFIFGFTGTPIFAQNAPKGVKGALKTTEQTFGAKLHTYTIVDAIRDENVLPFRIDYVNTIKRKTDQLKDDKKVKSIDEEKALMDSRRIENNVKYILDNFDVKTKRNKGTYSFSKVMNISDVASHQGKIDEIKQKVRLYGFNAILATASIDLAKMYYTEFKKQMASLGESKRLKIALIYSYGVNEDPEGFFMGEENNEGTDDLDQPSRDFLEDAIKDYNLMFKTNYDTSTDKFQNYYKDVSMRMKNREVDLLIVVNMFLTGFDATTLNTLWVDKNLKHHGLIQSFSRTNRILNSIKTFGNIVCFRDLQQETDDAIALFGNKDAGGVVLMKDYESYYYGYDDEKGHHLGYVEVVKLLKEKFDPNVLLMSEKEEKEFIKLFGTLLKLLNILTAFDQFKGMALLTDREMQDYQSMYIMLYEKYKKVKDGDKEIINDDVEFETELVKQIEVNLDYILMLVEKYQSSACQDKEIIVEIQKLVSSSMELRSKKDLIDAFIESVNTSTIDVVGSWNEFIKEKYKEDLQKIIQEEKLKEDETFKFMEHCFKYNELKTTGTDINKILPPVSMFGGRTQKKQRVIEKLEAFFERYEGLI